MLGGAPPKQVAKAAELRRRPRRTADPGLRQQGVTDPRVLAAMESVDRAVFVHEKFLDQAWEDQALPIDCAQTISQPYVVGLMTQALQVGPRHRVLEIGTGSGYQTAVLSRLARFVYSVERYRAC